MKILTHLSKKTINRVIEQEGTYGFFIDIDNAKYEAVLYGYAIMTEPFGKITNSKLKIIITFDDMKILKFQAGQKIEVDDENYYVSYMKSDGFCQKIEIIITKMK